MAVHKKFPALGRGLDALISTEEVHTSGSSSINEVPIGSIQANPNQPRREFDPAALEELAESIRQIGIIQPITLRKMDDGFYQIIAGERRWRASQLAGLDTIPAYIRTADDENMMQMALVETYSARISTPLKSLWPTRTSSSSMRSRKTGSRRRWGKPRHHRQLSATAEIAGTGAGGFAKQGN